MRGSRLARALVGAGLVGLPLVMTACSTTVETGTRGNPVSAAPTPTAPTSRAGEVAQALASSVMQDGVIVALSADYTASTDPDLLLGKPGQYTSAAAFTDSRCDRVDPGEYDALVITHGGIVEVWPDASSAQARVDSFTRLRAGSFLRPDETDLLAGDVVLRLCRGLRDDEVQAYAQTLASVASTGS